MQEHLECLEKLKEKQKLFDTTINDPTRAKRDNDQFIVSWENIFGKDFCDYLIDVYDNTDFLKYNLQVARNEEHRSDCQLDLQVLQKPINHHLMTGISFCLNDYLTLYPCLKHLIFFSICNLMQKTVPKQGYHTWHHEQQGDNENKRCLVWMLYLNDVEEGGETEFLYQQKKIKPKRGTVVIFPAGFTHQHRGNPPMSNKYIITGWFSSNFSQNGLTYYQYKDSKEL